ncbi:MAG: hypothetical protein PHX51_07270 [Clostridia bacterium]|nr:hypothetical protein [Clostridia bacterium]
MRILKLKLRGAIGIKKGLGVDEIEIDFTEFKSGLIALTGRNGSGKTTIMENLHPYRCMVSRSGSLQQHFFLKDSYRRLMFEHNSCFYDTRIMIDALTGASEAYLFKVVHNSHMEDGVEFIPLNDGKLSTYDIEIEKLLGSQELFFNSVFSGQKSKGIAELKPAERRKLFYELLNLNVYEGYLERAKAELKIQESKLAEIEGSINAIDVSEETEKELLAGHEKLVNEITHLQLEIADNEKILENTNQKIQELNIEISKGEDKLKGNDEIEKKLEEIANRTIELTDSHNSKVKRYQSEIDDSKKLVERNQKLLENKDKILGMLKERSEVELLLSTEKDHRSQLQLKLSEVQENHAREMEAINQLDKKISYERSDLQRLESLLYNLKVELSRSEAETKIIDQVPCGNKDSIISKYDFSKCQFLLNAFEGKAKIPDIGEGIEELSNKINAKAEAIEKMTVDYVGNKEKLEDHTDKVSGDLRKMILEVQGAIKRHEDRLKVINDTKWDELKEASDKAENQIALYEQKIGSTNHNIGDAVDSFNKSIEDLKKEAEELNSKLDVELPEKIGSLKYLLYEKTSELNGLKSTHNALTIDLNNANMNFAGIEEKLNQFTLNKEKAKSLNDQKAAVKAEIRDWTFLTKAFDKTGIPVLKLENSGIEITSIANDLLSLFENKFRIVFETTSLTKDKKKMKETFDINIVEDDGVCEIGNKSGGQQVYLETAIRLAISNVVKRQGRNLQTAFLDEADGALDIDNAYNYLQMISKAHELSGVYNTFIITHRPELLDFIPQQVKLSDGYLQILN